MTATVPKLLTFETFLAWAVFSMPKQPTVTVNQWVEGEYRGLRYQEGDRIESPLLPTLELTMLQSLAMTEA